jgi:hypothetical protein
MGCQPNSQVNEQARETHLEDRIAAIRLMLLKLGVHGDDPRWSSEVLDCLVTAVIRTPGGSVGDLFRALFGVLGDYRADLSKVTAGFIKDLVINCFTKHRASYEATDWTQITQLLRAGTTPAQLYLALHAIPPQYVSPELAGAIAAGLETTPFHQEALTILAA